MLVRLLNASLLVRRSAAIALSVVFLGIAYAITASLYGALVSTRNDVYEKRAELGRLLAIVAMEKSVKATNTARASTTSPAEFLPGENEAAARSGLQKRLSEAAATTGITVLSAGNAPTINEQGVVYVGLRANVSGSLENVHGLILNLETTLPVLFIREATLTATGSNMVTAQTSSTEISAQLMFYGVLQASAPAGIGESKS
ncbi:type II secretion system protein GspM [Mesorhizobium sp. 1M-11]|uniref:type II secretion system protein GspM n=1 Tax=Mesorhizobium sp. 1M-11 TaxID=1529006 RepID=UPI0006C770BD|nr:type II secretion system protein GspM [Mesorhizobium sp. 1M-11]